MPNRPVAEQCLNNLKRMLYKNPDFHNEINEGSSGEGLCCQNIWKAVGSQWSFLWWPEGTLKSDPVEYKVHVRILPLLCFIYVEEKSWRQKGEDHTPGSWDGLKQLSCVWLFELGGIGQPCCCSRQRPEGVLPQWRISFDQVDKKQ